jgi:hypothetical protein
MPVSLKEGTGITFLKIFLLKIVLAGSEIVNIQNHFNKKTENS